MKITNKLNTDMFFVYAGKSERIGAIIPSNKESMELPFSRIVNAQLQKDLALNKISVTVKESELKGVNIVKDDNIKTIATSTIQAKPIKQDKTVKPMTETAANTSEPEHMKHAVIYGDEPVNNVVMPVEVNDVVLPVEPVLYNRTENEKQSKIIVPEDKPAEDYESEEPEHKRRGRKRKENIPEFNKEKSSLEDIKKFTGGIV